MRNVFVETANVKRFLHGTGVVAQRGAKEACFLLVEGEAGYGKSRTGLWWGAQNQAVRVRAKAAATYHWVLKDILASLDKDEQPARSCEALYDQVFAIMAEAAKAERQIPIVLDEVENTLRDIKALQAVRDLSDYLNTPVILIAREFVAPKLRRHKDIWSRISDVVSFEPCSVEDVALCCRELAECDVAPPVVERIHRESEGRIREVVNAIAQVERIGKRNGGRATPDNTGDRQLTKEFQRRAPLRVVK